MSVVIVDNLTKRYGRRVGVEALSLRVAEGALFGFLGPNGSGKTTAIRVLLGLLRATGGSAHVFGLDCQRQSHVIKCEVGYVPGDLRLYPWLTLHDAVTIARRARGRDVSSEAMELADAFDLESDVSVRQMSRGMRQKLGIILALAHKPKLLILDEPTTALDPLMQEVLYARLRRLTDEGHTVLFSSHTLSEVEDLCDRVAILRRGRLVADETLDSLRVRAKRVVTLIWQSNASANDVQAPPFLDVHERRNREWHATLTGPAAELVRWGAGQPLEDVTIGPPDLGHLFRQYYEDTEANE